MLRNQAENTFWQGVGQALITGKRGLISGKECDSILLDRKCMKDEFVARREGKTGMERGSEERRGRGR